TVPAGAGRPRPESGRLERVPPHTPAPGPGTSLGAEGDVTALAPDVSDSGADLERIERKPSVVGMTLLVLLLLLALGLVGASAALKGTPDPRPLLEDFLRETMKR